MDVLFSGGYAAGQIGERPRQTHGAISPAQCELMIGQGPIDQFHRFQRCIGVQPFARSLRVAHPSILSEPVFGHLTGTNHTSLYPGTGLADWLALRGNALDWWRRHLNIHTIQYRSGQSREITYTVFFPASATFAGAVIVSARTGVGRHDELE